MKQEIFKSMYNQIGLDEEQKNEIWRNLQEKSEAGSTAKKARFTARAAAFAGIFLLSGMTVFAAGRLSLADLFEDTMKINTKNEQAFTQEQRDIYEQYGQILDTEIAASEGILKLEAVLYDEQFMIIPYILTPYSDAEGDKGDKNVITEMRNNNLCCRFKPDPEHERFGYSFGMSRSEYEGEDGVTTGRYIFDANKNDVFKQGDVVQFFTRDFIREDNDAEDKVLFEFTLGAMVESRSLTVDEASRKILEDNGLFIEKISLSPISFYCIVISKNEERCPISIILKDGSMLEEGRCNYYSIGKDIGEYAYSDDRLKKEYPYWFSFHKLFSAPVRLEEIEGIRIRVGITDIRIPLEEQ